jgi:hypothetical protein
MEKPAFVTPKGLVAQADPGSSAIRLDTWLQVAEHNTENLLNGPFYNDA